MSVFIMGRIILGASRLNQLIIGVFEAFLLACINKTVLRNTLAYLIYAEVFLFYYK